MKKSVLLLTAAGALLLASVTQAEVKWIKESPRAAKVAAAQAARSTAPAARSIMARETWAGSRAIIFDAQTKTLRKPTASETGQMVQSLRQMTSRPVRMIAPVVQSNGTRQGSIDGEHANVVIARATEDGSYETLCVQTFEEAAEFLGLVRLAPGTGSNQ